MRFGNGVVTGNAVQVLGEVHRVTLYIGQRMCVTSKLSV